MFPVSDLPETKLVPNPEAGYYVYAVDYEQNAVLTASIVDYNGTVLAAAAGNVNKTLDLTMPKIPLRISVREDGLFHFKLDMGEEWVSTSTDSPHFCKTIDSNFGFFRGVMCGI